MIDENPQTGPSARALPPPPPASPAIRRAAYLPVPMHRAVQLAGTLTNEEFGVYVRLLLAAWMQGRPGSLPDEPALLRGWAGVDRSWWSEHSRKVMADFELCNDGRRYHSSLVASAAKYSLRADSAEKAWRGRSS